MSRPIVTPTGRESRFDTEEIIVSKTDLQGRITYANDVFLRVAGFSEEEILGQPHNIIRHPDMPHSVFKLLWDTLQTGEEIFAYVINMARNGDHYWVFAHVTPSFDASGAITGYHSNRRKPDPEQVEKVKTIYSKLCEIEAAEGRLKDGMAAAIVYLQNALKSQGTTYDRFVFAL
ncbi:MAG: PAS domain-containing protein [Kiloniellaceae bacterium]